MVYGKFFDCALRWISHYTQKLNISALPVTINLLLHMELSYFSHHWHIMKMREEFYQGIFQDRPKPSDTGDNNHNGPLLTWKRRFMSYKVPFHTASVLYWQNLLKWLGSISQLAISETAPIKFQHYGADNKPKQLPILNKAIITSWYLIIFPTDHLTDEAPPWTTSVSIFLYFKYLMN